MSKKAENNDLVVKTDYQVSETQADLFTGMGLGAGEEIDTSDILIPKLLLTQALTKAVARGKIAVGKYMNSTTLQDMGTKFEAIVIQSYKVWQVYKVVPNQKDEYIETLDFYGNEHLEYQFTDKGVNYKRKQVLGFYVLLLDEITKGVAFPYIVDFKGGSKKAGRELTSHFAKLRSVNLPSFAKVFTFGNELIEDDNTYYVKTVDMGRDITRQELDAVKNWITELKKNKANIKVDDSDEKENGDDIVEVESKPINQSASGTKF